MYLTSFVFLLGFAGGLLAALVRHPIFGLLTYVAVFYLHPPSRWWGAAMPDLRWSLTAAAVTLAAVLMRKDQRASLPLFRHKVMVGLVLCVLWLALQTAWALDVELHLELVGLFAKYLLLIFLIYRCVDSERHLRWFVWMHILGCFYLGWIAYSEYEGGRFEDFGGPGIGEANSGALQIVTGILIAASMFIAGKLRERAVLVACMPFLVNAMIVTVSRSAFLAAGFGGLVFNLFAPLRFRKLVRIASVLGIVLFVLLTNPLYWTRMGSLKHAGEQVEDVDTGTSRLVLMEAQLKMFAAHPLGCGHRCTALLSTAYLDDIWLSGPEDNRGRSSHSTVLTMLVEHGIVGLVLYALYVVWAWRAMRRLWRQFRGQEGFIPIIIPGIAASLAAVTIGDLFVDYLKMEVRLWLIALAMVLVRMHATALQEKPAGSSAPAPALAATPTRP